MRISDWSSDLCSADLINFDARVLEEMESGARNFLIAAAQDLAAKGVKADSVVTIGNATDGIVWEAERESAGLIVMSTNGRDRKSVVEGKRVSGRVDIDGRRIVTKQKAKINIRE